MCSGGEVGMEGIHVRPAIDADTDRLVEAVIDQQEYERKL